MGVAGGGAVVCCAAAQSLKAWKARKSSTPYTALGAGVAAALCVTVLKTISAVASKASQSFVYGFAALSAVMAIFLVYVIAAGGNPPPCSARATGATSSSTASPKEP